MGNKSGYELWQSYEKASPDILKELKPFLSAITLLGESEILSSTFQEAQKALSRLSGQQIPAGSATQSKSGIILGTYAPLEIMLPGIGDMIKRQRITSDEAYHLIRYDQNTICITSPSDRGVLYGVFALLRLIQSENDINALWTSSSPRLGWRMLNHWDNPDGSIERGYAGNSLWKWSELPDSLDPRYTDYARACASIGINASVLNNVNTEPRVLDSAYLRKIAAIADVLRAWGITTFLSVNFGSPMRLGALADSDPLNPDVAAWWKAKAQEIYSYIPDFGGFLVKADSEGQPGPYGYGRDHAEGANMLAEALEPHGGLVIWRAFVYGFGESDRAKKAWADFKPLDGKFRPNAAVQVKNGAIDFQPREPVHPLFGAMSRTTLFMEFQITQEYLGQGNHIVYLGPMWKEILDFDITGQGLSVGKSLENCPGAKGFTGIAAVSNIGDQKTWCGSHFHPLNWYAYGRLAWDYQLDPGKIADEWLCQTFAAEPEFHIKTHAMLMQSWEACIDYMTPLGLHHIMREHHHYGPDPAFDGGEREDWRSTYYHRADTEGLGFDRTREGSNAVDQYHKPVADLFNSLTSCPEKYLLWFHHVPWDHILSDGNSLKEELKNRYRRGVRKAEQMLKTWQSLQGTIDDQRYTETLQKLEIQAKDAREWEAVCVPYFSSFTNTAETKQPKPPSDQRSKQQ